LLAWTPLNFYTDTGMPNLALVPAIAEFTTPKTESRASPIKSGIGHYQPKLVQCSQVRGRERWYVDALEDNSRLAAAVELVLRSEEGIEGAGANPLTGRVLVHYNPDLLSESIEVLIRRAIEFGPMSREEFSALQSKQAPVFSAKHLFAAELGCSAVKLFLLGGCCPLGLAAASALLFCYRRL
jgi:hypothetical protein